LPEVIVGRAQDLIGVEREPGEVDGAGRRGAHALRPPGREVGPRAGLDRHHHHRRAGLCRMPRGDEGAGDEAGARRIGLHAAEMAAGVRGLDPQAAFARLGVPDTEQVAGARVREQADALGGRAVPGDELEGVDVAFVEPAEGEAPVADQPQNLRQGTGARLRPQARAAVIHRDGRGEQTQAGEIGDVVLRKAVVVILGVGPRGRRRGDRAGGRRGIVDGVQAGPLIHAPVSSQIAAGRGVRAACRWSGHIAPSRYGRAAAEARPRTVARSGLVTYGPHCPRKMRAILKN
jgi:hypothetical protein